MLEKDLDLGYAQLALGPGVHNNFRNKAKQDELEQTDRKPEARPIMSILHNLQTIPIEIHVAIKIHIVERLHRNLILPSVLEPVSLILEREVMFDWTTRKPSLLILPRRERGR